MKNLISILLSMLLVMAMAGCTDDKDNSGKTNNTVVNKDDKNEPNIEDKLPSLKLDATYADTTNMYNGRSLSEITLYLDGTVNSSSCAAEGGCTDLKGTYKIEGTSLIVTFTEYRMLDIWEKIPDVKDDIYTIIQDNKFSKETSSALYELYS